MQTFKNKTVAIVGLSIEGMDSVVFFASEGAKITCCDRRNKDELGSTYDTLASYGVSFQLGDTYLDKLETFDIVVRTPGMLLRAPEFEKLKKQGKHVTSLTKLFFELCSAPIIGVTGTKGKGTTSTLIFTMLEKAGKHVHLGGNVGKPLLSKVRKIHSHDWVILELSSFQLEDLKQSPHVAVVLRVTQEHLANFDTLATNFHESKQTYREAKKSIVRYQKKTDYVVCNLDDEVSTSFAKETVAKPNFFSRSKQNADSFIRDNTVILRVGKREHIICTKEKIKLRGMHNLENIAASSLAASLAGADVASLQFVARTFAGLEHRLELAGVVDGVSYFNDSFSTVPETAIAAIESFEEPMILIAGGSEKGSDFTQLGCELAKNPVKVLVAIGAMTDRIVQAAKDGHFKGKIIMGATTMHEIVAIAKKEARKGDVVLLSPACASFGMFKNYKDRGHQFKHEVSLL